MWSQTQVFQPREATSFAISPNWYVGTKKQKFSWYGTIWTLIPASLVILDTFLNELWQILVRETYSKILTRTMEVCHVKTK